MFWDKLIKNKEFNLSNFRNTKKHNIFANWNPYKRGLTYHNYLIYNFNSLIPKILSGLVVSLFVYYLFIFILLTPYQYTYLNLFLKKSKKVERMS